MPIYRRIIEPILLLSQFPVNIDVEFLEAKMDNAKKLELTFKAVFHVSCLCIVIVLVTGCIFQYLRDDDFTMVEYKKFNNKSTYPSFTYCFQWPILGAWSPKPWKKFGNEDVNSIRNDYLNYLEGRDVEDANFTESDYDQLSKKLEDFMPMVEAGLENNGVVQWSFGNGSLTLKKAFRRFSDIRLGNKITLAFDSEKMKGISTPSFYISHRGVDRKCYTFDIPWIKNEQVNRFTLYIKPELLPGKTIKPIDQQKDFFIAFHYPRQTLRALSTASGFSSSIDISQHYRRQFKLANIEVLRRRNKPSKPCIDGGYDEEIIQRTIESFGCKPRTIKLGDRTNSACNYNSTLQFQSSLINNQHPPPCKGIQSITEFHGELDLTEWLKTTDYEGRLMLEIQIQDPYYKEMVYREAYPIESLIGNSGGYIG